MNNTIIKYFKNWGFILFILLILEIFIIGLVNPNFLNISNLLYSSNDFMHIVIVSIPFTLILVTGGIDISITSVMGLTSIVFGMLHTFLNMPFFLAIILALLCASLCGLINGFLVSNTDINPLVITLGTMFLYKGINTMDSMLGYKNDRYLYFGRCAAKLDDAANYLPARISGILMIAGAFVIGLDSKNAARIFKRDNRNHASPNSAQTEAAMAGALDVQLAGNAYYFGKLYEKPTIGDSVREIEAADIRYALRLMYATAILSILLCILFRVLIMR